MAVSSENAAEAPGTRDRAVRGALEAIREVESGSGLKDHEAISSLPEAVVAETLSVVYPDRQVAILLLPTAASHFRNDHASPGLRKLRWTPRPEAP